LAFDEPKQHWHIEKGEDAELRPGRRPALYFYGDPKTKPERNERGNVGG
jgi:type III restriction enzyme